jgi:hypothetical protein
MRTPDQYRELAAECYRLAAEARTEKDCKILEEIARALERIGGRSRDKELVLVVSSSCYHAA